jgi:hypothetical protein
MNSVDEDTRHIQYQLARMKSAEVDFVAAALAAAAGVASARVRHTGDKWGELLKACGLPAAHAESLVRIHLAGGRPSIALVAGPQGDETEGV